MVKNAFLMSNLSPIDHNLFLVYPCSCFIFAIELIEVPDSGMNPWMQCFNSEPKGMVDGNPKTKSRLEKKGIQILTMDQRFL